MRLTLSLRKIGRSLGRRNKRSIAIQAVRHPRVCNHVVSLIGEKLAKEMKAMCAKKNNSILRQKPVDAIQTFRVENVIDEMEKLAPHTLTLLRSCLSGRTKPKAKNVNGKGQTQVRMFDIDRIVAICCAVILRGRSQSVHEPVTADHFNDIILWTCS